ncbi:hypothetical protein ABZW30_23435 [Kitasatospora sp. NPDC004669]|uniref:hypothetical protein n=1 Tax=Kitasatospora sp. NPDC004669 TaxID=3154555 RepID=UPI0033B24D3D
MLAARAAEALRSRLNTTRRPGDPEVLQGVVERLAAHGGCAHGLFAVGLAHALGPRTGWPPHWRALLRTLRQHPRPDVREAALAARTAVGVRRGSPHWARTATHEILSKACHATGLRRGHAAGPGPWRA